MKRLRHLITIMLAVFVVAGTLVISTSAQTRIRRSVRQPGVVRYVVVRDPFWRYRYYRDPFWGYGYYDPYWDSPYLRYMDRKYRLERELQGNLNELRKHRAKYTADGYLTAKERRELADDIRDVERSRRKLNAFTRVRY